MRGTLFAFVALSLLVATPFACFAQGVPQVTFRVDRYAIEGDTPIPQAEIQAVLTPYLGEHTGIAGLQEAALAVEQALRERGFAFHRVTIPPQTAKGVITFLILRFTVNQVTVTGNEHFDEPNIRAALPALEPGETPNARELARALALANEHPARQVQVQLSESEVPDTIDAELQVRDQRPWRVFAALANTGTSGSGRERLSLGGQHSNLFGLDHTATLSYTTNPQDTGKVRQYGVNYRAPLYDLAAQLSLFYTHSDADTGRVAEFFDVSGSGDFAGARYTQLLLPVGDYSHRLTLGVDDRSFRNDISFVGTPIGVDVRSRPISLDYSGRLDRAWGYAAFSADYTRNLPGGSNNTATAYAATRVGAERSWQSLHGAVDAAYRLPADWVLSARVRTQYSGEALIPGEQFGMGGANSVRGFEERAVTGDRGLHGSLELWAPALPGDINLLGFLDGGHVQREDLQPGERGREAIASVGLGLRWRWERNATLSLDWGHVLEGAPGTRDGHDRVHATFAVRY